MCKYLTSKSNWNLEVLVCMGGGKPGVPEEKSSEQGLKPTTNSTHICVRILGDPGAASWGDGIFTGESFQQERESPWAFNFTERVPEAFEIPLADWPENFSGSPVFLVIFRS